MPLLVLLVILPPVRPDCATVRVQEEGLAGVTEEVIENDRSAQSRQLLPQEKVQMLPDGVVVPLCHPKVGSVPEGEEEGTRGRRCLKEGGTEMMIGMDPLGRQGIGIGAHGGIEGRAGAKEGISIQERVVEREK